MRLFITIAVVTLALSCWARPADDDYSNYDDETPVEPSPSPPPKAPARHALIGSRTARGPSPLIGSRGKTTTTTPPPKPAEPEEVNEPESLDEEAGEEVEEQAPVTTEAPKKGLKAGVVRPFRSNQDLLAALKRKRQQEHYRVVYEYLFVRFGYPVNLHHQLDLSLDPETGVGDAQSEYNEVTSGDNDPPPKLKPGDHELVTVRQELVREEPVREEPVRRQEPGDDEPIKIELNKGEPYENTNVKVESSHTVEVNVEPVKIEPVKVEPVKVEPIKVEPAEAPVKLEPVNRIGVRVEEIRVKPVEIRIEPAKVEPVKSIEIRVEPAKVEPVKVEPVNPNAKAEVFKVETVTNVAVKVEPAGNVEKLKVNQLNVKEEPVRANPVKVELGKVRLDPVKRETLKGGPAQSIESVRTAESVKIETIRPLEVHTLPVKVEQMNGTTIFTSASYSVSYS